LTAFNEMMRTQLQYTDFSDPSVDPPVRGYLHLPSSFSSGEALVLTHGAGSNAQAPLLFAIAQTFSAAGIAVLRCDLPFRQRHPHGPPRPGDATRDREGLRNAVNALQKQSAGRVFLSGHSYGGRQASLLSAAEPDLAGGLLLFSYPLHPPRKPAQLRTQHLSKLRTPAFFVHGTRDPFGSISELEEAIKAIPARTKLMKVEGAGHDLNFGKKADEGVREDLPAAILAAFQPFFS
jgi:uncharacterized protein